MDPSRIDHLIGIDKRHIWHPFTQMRAWCDPDHEPLIIAEGNGAILRDQRGREYIDGNSSIWTNVHGHRHATMDRTISQQLNCLAHSSFLGFTNEPAIELAERLVDLFPGNKLSRVFYSDNGSTAIEVALKMALQYWQLTGKPQRTKCIAFQNAYHGDTLGAASLGGINVFHGRFSSFGLPVLHIQQFEELTSIAADDIAAICIEPKVQGAAGIRLWPEGLLQQLRSWCDENDVFLIFDEVMTGFGRTGRMFACEHENVLPDFIALAKGLTGGYMPLAVTLTTERVYEAFLGEYWEQKTFYYGHSYCGNPLGCAAALGSLQVFREEQTLERLQPKIARFSVLLNELKQRSAHIGPIRQLGFLAGIDLQNSDGTLLDTAELTGTRVCFAAREFGLLTRPIRDTIVLMPPFCITEEQLEHAIEAIEQAIQRVLA